MIVFTIIGAIVVIFFITVLLVPDGNNQNIMKWLRFHENLSPFGQDIRIIELRSAIDPFFIPDNIDIDKYLRNQRAFDALEEYYSYEVWNIMNNSSSNPEPPLNPTKSFLKIDSIGHRAKAIPFWFNIAYPDVSIWFSEKQRSPEYAKKMESKYGEDFNVLQIIRDLINEYKAIHGQLELACS